MLGLGSVQCRSRLAASMPLAHQSPTRLNRAMLCASRSQIQSKSAPRLRASDRVVKTTFAEPETPLLTFLTSNAPKIARPRRVLRSLPRSNPCHQPSTNTLGRWHMRCRTHTHFIMLPKRWDIRGFSLAVVLHAYSSCARFL